MKTLKRILSVIIIIFFMNSILAQFSKGAMSNAIAETKPVKVAVFLLDFTDDLISAIGENLKDIQKENPGKVELTFYDAKSDEATQNAQVEEALNKDIDLILLNIVNRGSARQVINRIKEYNIPVILFNREPVTPVPIQSYGKALYIGTDGTQAGALQGKMLIDVWNASRQYIDKNEDNIMQYVILQGEGDNTEAIQRTKYSVSTIDKAGIQTQQVALEICDWREDLAYNAMKTIFEKYKNQIEVIIANDDSMAIGAVKALQENGYNKGDISKTIPIVGVDVTPEAKEFIEKGYMLGSVYQTPRAYAEALYTCGMNMIAEKSPVEGTKYTLDDTKVSIRLPQTNYFYKNMFEEENTKK